MTPTRMAELHQTSGPDQRAWSEQEYRDFLADPKTIIATTNDGFALGTVIFDQAELCMIIVDKQNRSHGIGCNLLGEFEQKCALKGATEILLEVSQENAPARALYEKLGFLVSGRRKGYYKSASGQSVDAIVMVKQIK